MPWLPDPEFDITAMGAPPMRASQAADVSDSMWAIGVSPKMLMPW